MVGDDITDDNTNEAVNPAAEQVDVEESTDDTTEDLEMNHIHDDDEGADELITETSRNDNSSNIHCLRERRSQEWGLQE